MAKRRSHGEIPQTLVPPRHAGTLAGFGETIRRTRRVWRMLVHGVAAQAGPAGKGHKRIEQNGALGPRRTRGIRRSREPVGFASHYAARMLRAGEKEMIAIRAERADDRAAVFAVHSAAFPTDEEAQLVNALRDAGKAVVSLVAESDGRIV